MFAVVDCRAVPCMLFLPRGVVRVAQVWAATPFPARALRFYQQVPP